MHSVLTVDLSANPSEISVSSIDGNLVAVVERASVDLSRFLTSDILKGTSVPTKIDDGDDVDSTTTVESDTAAELTAAAAQLRECLAGINSSWGSSVVVIPPIDFISLNLSLPFGDSRNLNKIIDLEIQDVVPFDIDEFLVQYRTLSNGSRPLLAMKADLDSGREHDVHVGLIPRAVIRNVIDLSHRCNLEPVVVVSPSSAVAGVFQIAPDYFKENSAIIVFQPGTCSVAVRVNGEVRAERILKRTTDTSPEDDMRALFSDIRLTLASIEKRYGSRITHVYVMGTIPKLSQLQQSLARPVEPFILADVVRCDQQANGTGPLAAIFAREEDVGSVLTNFRVREFAYSPRFTELLSALRSAGTYVCIALVMAFVALGSFFGARQYQIRQQETALVSEIMGIIPDFSPPGDGDVISAIRSRETLLSEQLGALGSPSRNTPLDAFASLSKDLPNDIPNLRINSMKIRSGNLSFEGVAPDLSAVAKVEKALQNDKTAFRKVTATTGAADPKSGYRFTVEILLNQ